MRCDVMAPQMAAFTVSGTDDHRQARKTHDKLRLQDTRYLRLSPRCRRCFCLLVCPRLPTSTRGSRHATAHSLAHSLTAQHTKATHLPDYLPIHSPTPHLPHHAPPSGHTHPGLLSRALGLVYQVSRTATACGRITLAPMGAPARNVPLRHASLAPCRRLSPSGMGLRPKSLNSLSTQTGRQVLGNAADRRQDVESARGAPRKAAACMAGRLSTQRSAAQQERERECVRMCTRARRGVGRIAA
jgi:hypothetical protein